MVEFTTEDFYLDVSTEFYCEINQEVNRRVSVISDTRRSSLVLESWVGELLQQKP